MAEQLALFTAELQKLGATLVAQGAALAAQVSSVYSVSYGVYMGVREDLCGFYGKLLKSFREAFTYILLLFLGAL